MEHFHENYERQLKHLLSVVNDGWAGYKEASEQAHSPMLRELFKKFSEERRDMATELRKHILSLKEGWNNDGDTKGAFHRALMSVKTALTKDENDDRVLLESCREGDRAAMDSFDDVLQGTLLETSLKPFLTGLRLKISSAFNEVDKLYFEEFRER